MSKKALVAFVIGVVFLNSAAHLAKAQTLTALQRAAQFGISDIRGIAYHPGPSLNGCPSTVNHNCPGKIPIYQPGTPQDTLPYFQNSLQTWDVKQKKQDNLQVKYTIYYDSDFYNEDFQALWGSTGRDDLQRYKNELNLNFIHIYDWNPDTRFRNHRPFLDYASSRGIRVTIPISNDIYEDLCQNRSQWRDRVASVFNEIYSGGSQVPHPAAGVLKIFNEYDGSNCHNAKHVADVAARWKELEDQRNVQDPQRLPIIFPVTFGIKNGLPGGAVLEAFKAIESHPSLGLLFWRHRVIYAVNPFNRGDEIKNWFVNDLSAFFARNGIPSDTPVMFTEYGRSSLESEPKTEAGQAEWVKGQFEAMYKPTKPQFFLGATAFVNEFRFWLKDPEPDFALTDLNKGGGTWNKPPAMTIQRVKYFNPNAANPGVDKWDASYQIDPQKPRQAYCEVAKVYGVQTQCP